MNHPVLHEIVSKSMRHYQINGNHQLKTNRFCLPKIVNLPTISFFVMIKVILGDKTGEQNISPIRLSAYRMVNISLGWTLSRTVSKEWIVLWSLPYFMSLAGTRCIGQRVSSGLNLRVGSLALESLFVPHIVFFPPEIDLCSNGLLDYQTIIEKCFQKNVTKTWKLEMLYCGRQELDYKSLL